MVQKKILSVFVFILSLFILSDIYKVIVTDTDTSLKLDYLFSLHPPSEFAQFSKAIDIDVKKRKSLETYYERLKAAKLESNDFEDSIIWPHFIDSLDLPAFTKGISEIPPLADKNMPELEVMRNKFINIELVKYLSSKVASSAIGVGDCFSSFSIVKDLSNNLSLADCGSFTDFQFLSINNHPIKKRLNDTEFKIPLADSLDIAVMFYYSKKNSFLPDSDTLIQHYTIDISKIPDGTSYY